MARIGVRSRSKDPQLLESKFEVFFDNPSDYAVLLAACRATPQCGAIGAKEDQVSLDADLPIVLALQATGFQWENDAAVEALSILAGAWREASYIDLKHSK